MLNIKEIALKHAREYLTFKLGGRKGLDVEEIVCDDEIYKEIVNELAQQFEALIAEIAKQNEHIGAIQNGKFQWNTEGGPEKWRARKDFSGKLYTVPLSVESLQSRIAELDSQLAEAKKDAERYRWLRDTLTSAVGGGVRVNDAALVYEESEPCGAVQVYWYPDTPVGFYESKADSLDEAIDTAIRKLGEQE